MAEVKRQIQFRVNERMLPAIRQGVRYQDGVEDVEILIPSDVRFADLDLFYKEGVGLVFDWTPIQKICDASGIDIAFFKPPKLDNVIDLLVNWYGQALRNGEPRDPVADLIWAEAFANTD